MSDELDDHRLYLSDRPRIDAFARAIAGSVKPGDIVVDLGCGTGILGLLACRAGASRVYAIESGGMAEIAEAVAAANGYGDRVTIVRGHSENVSLPERADLVVADQIGGFGFEAGVLEFFADARRRFLKPDGRFLPREVTLCIAPVEHPAVHDDASFWSRRPAGFDMSPAQSIASNSGYPRAVTKADLLAAGARGASLLLGLDHSSFSFSARFTIDRPGTMHGVAGWFVAELSDGVFMTNAPDAPDRITRRSVIFPVPEPLPVEAGETVCVEMFLRPADLVVKWTVACGARRFEQSTFAGMLISPEVLRWTRPHFVPRLTERGRARKLVLDLAERQSSIAEIERSLFETHRALFDDPADAGVFVAEVVTRYAE